MGFALAKISGSNDLALYLPRVRSCEELAAGAGMPA
jgi:hypothetical protein